MRVLSPDARDLAFDLAFEGGVELGRERVMGACLRSERRSRDEGSADEQRSVVAHGETSQEVPVLRFG